MYPRGPASEEKRGGEKSPRKPPSSLLLPKKEGKRPRVLPSSLLLFLAWKEAKSTPPFSSPLS